MISSLGATAQASICGAISSWSTYRLHPFARHLLWPFRMPLNQCYNFAPSKKCHPKSSKNHQCHVLPWFFVQVWNNKTHEEFPPMFDHPWWTLLSACLCCPCRPGVGRSEPQRKTKIQRRRLVTHRRNGKNPREKVVGRPNPGLEGPILYEVIKKGVMTAWSLDFYKSYCTLPETNSEKTPLKIGGWKTILSWRWARPHFQWLSFGEGTDIYKL